MRSSGIAPESLGALAFRSGAAHATGEIMMFFESELFSAESASLIPRTFRAHSISAYWNPPQVPRNGQSRRRANSMPRNIPSKLLYGLPGAAHKPSKASSLLSSSGSTRDSVGSHWAFTEAFSFSAAYWIDFSIDGSVGEFGL